jgi:ribonuclease HII
MAILVGTDEAGYGPNLGPLIVSATAWRVPDRLQHVDLYDLLERLVDRGEGSGAFAIADSKLLYRPGSGLAALERGVLAAVSLVHGPVRRWREAWQVLAPRSMPDLEELPWCRGYDCSLPVACQDENDAWEQSCAALGQGLQDRGVSLVGQSAVALFPRTFNTLVQDLGTKGAALSQTTIELIQKLLDDYDDRTTIVLCDKHGGRNRYGPLLQTQFPQYLVEVVRESRALSVYRWGPRHRRVEFRFAARGEQFLPAALASMTAKYLRELAMQAFNDFWRQQLPEIRPTAGYPVDARRFRHQIEPLLSRLGIADAILWRDR